MSKTVFVVPAQAGAKLRHPVSGLLPDGGGDWLADQFTFRLIKEGAISKSALTSTTSSTKTSNNTKTDNT